MTRFLLENVFGSSGSEKPEKSDPQTEAVIDEIGYLPSVYMIRRLGGLDDIKFKLFRYAQAVDGIHQASHGLIEIELIESGHAGGSNVSSQPLKDSSKELLSRLNNDIQISADLSYSQAANNKGSKAASVPVPGGRLYARANEQSAVVTDQVSVNKPASPVIFNVALGSELAEELWAGFEQEEVTLELSIHWLLAGEERGEPFQHVITQSIPINTSMSSQRNCFNKYETWADFEHDHSELHVQCFSFVKEGHSGLSNVEVATELKDGEVSIVTKRVEFTQLDSEFMQTLLFPESVDLDNPAFAITATYHFDDGTSKNVEYSSHKLRYFDASLPTS